MNITTPRFLSIIASLAFVSVASAATQAPSVWPVRAMAFKGTNLVERQCADEKSLIEFSILETSRLGTGAVLSVISPNGVATDVTVMAPRDALQFALAYDARPVAAAPKTPTPAAPTNVPAIASAPAKTPAPVDWKKHYDSQGWYKAPPQDPVAAQAVPMDPLAQERMTTAILRERAQQARYLGSIDRAFGWGYGRGSSPYQRTYTTVTTYRFNASAGFGFGNSHRCSRRCRH